MKNWIKRVNAFFLAAVMLITAVFSGVTGLEVAEAGTVTSTKPDDGDEMYLYNDGHISYSGYGTHYFKTSKDSGKDFSWYAYCADPVGSTPEPDYYEVDYDIENYTVDHLGGSTMSETLVERIVYQLYGQPEEDRLKTYVNSLFGSTDWTKEAWDDESYYVLSHVIVSCLFGSIEDAFYGTSDDFSEFFENAYDNGAALYIDYGSDKKVYSVIASMTYYFSTYYPGNMDSTFDVYVLKTQDVNSGYQLILGTYYYQETTTPDYGYIQLTKSSSNTSITSGNDSYDLLGAVYGIYTDEACTNRKQSITTNSSGVATSTSLEVGTYYLKEITAPDGYVLSTDVVEVEVDSTTSATYVTVSDTPAADSGTLTITKKDAESGSTPQGDASLSGAQYTIKYYDGQYSSSTSLPSSATKTWIIKTDSDGVAKLDSSHLVSGTLYTNSSGSVVMPIGTYTVTETTAPTGYNTDDATFTVSGSTTSSNFLLMNVTQSTNGGSASLSVSHSITNEDTPDTGRVTITKVDADTLEATAQGDGDLSGAVFTIYNNSENPIYYNGDAKGKNEAVTTITTNESGVATLSSNSLPYGTYYAKETTAPTGYLLDNTTVYNFTIRSNGQIATATASDEIKRGGFTVTKVDADTQVATAQGDGSLAGAKFTVYNVSDSSVVVNGKTYATGTSSSNNGTVTISGKTYYLGAAVLTTAATGSNGKVTVDTSTLPYGTYVIMETTAPTGYLVSEDAYVFTIRSDGESKSITIDDEIIRGGVEIYKRDYETNLTTPQGDATLEGATFEIINDSDAAVVVNGVSYAVGETVLTLTTDENGYASTGSDTLPYGSYIILR